MHMNSDCMSVCGKYSTCGQYKSCILHQAVRIFIVYIILSTAGFATDAEKRRVVAGLELFQAFLSSDTNIENKVFGNDKLLLLIVYDDDMDGAEKMAGQLRKTKKIRGVEVLVNVTRYTGLSSSVKLSPAGIFLAEQLIGNLDEVVKYSTENRILLFSPFEGDVERGVMCGIHISDRVLPFINKQAMANSGIVFKKFLLRVAKYHYG